MEGSSNFGKCRTTTTNSPEVRTSAFTTPMSLSCTAPQQVPLLTTTCSFQLLPLPILTVRINLQKKCHRKPPRSCRSHAWPLTTQRKKDTVSRAGSPNSPGSNCSNSAQCWKQDHAPHTSLATGKPGQPLWLHPAPKTGHSCKCCLHTGAITGQQLCPSSGTPAIPKGARAAGTGQITVPMKQEAGDKHKQLPNFWAPRLSPRGGHLDTSTCSSEPCTGYPGWPKPGPGGCRERTQPSTLQSLGGGAGSSKADPAIWPIPSAIPDL